MPDMSTIDPYEVLGVAKNFEWDDLKASYKRIAKLVHPDKGGSEVLFNTVTECFRILAHEYKARQEKNHNDLRQSSRDYISNLPIPSSLEPISERGNDDNFLDRFNRTFEQNRLDDDEGNADGYGSKMVKSSKVREDFKIDKVMKKFDNTAFNKVFETTTLPTTKQVVTYKEPEPLPLARKIQYTELGKAATDDYSSTTEGEGRGLQYTDYMKAHTTTRLIDPRSIKQRRDYKSVDDFEAARAEAQARPETADERRWREKKERDAENYELERLARLKRRDDRATQHFENVQRLMLNR
jgi:hypothetical protein